LWKNMAYIVRLSPEGWIKKQEGQDATKEEDVEMEGQDIKGNAKRSAWARLINKVYGINQPDRDTHGRVECRWNQGW
jgi:hypothetical protein